MVLAIAAGLQMASLSLGGTSTLYTGEEGIAGNLSSPGLGVDVPVVNRSAEAQVAPGPQFPPPDLTGLTVYVPTPAPTKPAVAAAAVATPVPVVPQYGYIPGNVEQWRPLVASIFPAFAVEPMLRIINCESGGNPNATGAAGERGLAQIHPLHFDSTYDPEANLRAAYRISGGGVSWAAWTCKP